MFHSDLHLAAMIQSFGGWTYALLGLIIFCETGLVVTPFLPGDSLLFAAGMFAARGALDLPLLVVTLTAAAIAGDTVNYGVGYSAGAWLSRRRHRFIRQEYLTRTQRFYERHGGLAIILARFLPIIRTFAPCVAGMVRMSYRRFLWYNVAGGALWILLFVVGGYLVGNLPVVRAYFSAVVMAIIVVSLAPVVLELCRRREAE